jgi:hypothetical protein
VRDSLIEINASVGELSEGSLLLEFGGLLGILMNLSVSASVAIFGDAHVVGVSHDCGDLLLSLSIYRSKGKSAWKCRLEVMRWIMDGSLRFVIWPWLRIPTPRNCKRLALTRVTWRNLGIQ